MKSFEQFAEAKIEMLDIFSDKEKKELSKLRKQTTDIGRTLSKIKSSATNPEAKDFIRKIEDAIDKVHGMLPK